MLESDAQAQRSTTGRAFGAVVTTIMEHALCGTSLTVVAPTQAAVRDALGSSHRASQLLRDLELTRALPCAGDPLRLLSRNLLLIDVRAARALALLDCTVSLHSRQAETCFWASQLSDRLHYALIFQDREVYTHRRSELGASCQQATTARKMLEAFVGGVYLLKAYAGSDAAELQADLAAFRSGAQSGPVFDHPGAPGHTAYCSQVQPLDTLLRKALTGELGPTRSAG